MKKFDTAIIGGGSAGLAAAISAKRTDKSASLCIIERLPKTGKKLLATGNGRCNLSNSDLSAKHYHGSCKPLLAQTERFSVPGLFVELGMICDDDGYGRIYPHCRSAASVLDALRLECAKLGVEEICGAEVVDIAKRGSVYELRTDSGVITAHTVIIAGGGKSQSSLGSNGSALGMCEKLGIKTVPAYPALVPLKTDTALVKPLKGQRADAEVTFCADGKMVKGERGEVQFTDGLLSGICVFDLSYLYERHKKGSEMRLDMLPDMSFDEVRELLKTVCDIRKTAPSEDFLSGIFTRPMGIYILKRALGKPPELTGDMSNEQLSRITKTIKSLSFPITGTAGFERSQVTGGGVHIDEVSDTFELKRMKGVYVCGELLDIIGDCGGCNLDFAFSSGAIAGRNAAMRR